MKVKTETLTGKPLAWAVAKAEGFSYEVYEANRKKWEKGVFFPQHWRPDEDPAQGQPILDREGISIVWTLGTLGEPLTYWIAVAEPQAWTYGYGPYHEQDEEKSIAIYKNDSVATGPTMLVAGLRCYVASKLGTEIDIPEGLL